MSRRRTWHSCRRCKWPGAQHRCGPTAKSNTSVRDTDSQKYEGGRVVAVLSFDRCVSVLPNESGLNETNIDCP